MTTRYKISAIFLFLLALTSCSKSIYQVPYYYKDGYQEEEFPPIPPQSYKQNKGLVVVDPGHGGDDLGTHSEAKKYQEKTLNLSTAFMLKNYLQQFGFEVLMTRTKDVFIPLNKRASMANEQNPLLFVSVHYNSAPSPEAEGVEVYYYKKGENKKRIKESQALAQAVLNRVISNTHARSRGVKHGNYAVVRETTMPAILIEGGFLTNANELQKIKSAEYLKKLALGIAQGINDYVDQE